MVWAFFAIGAALCWGLYGPILSALGRGTLNAQLHVVRMRWMRMLLQTHRDHRTFDALMMGHISNSMAFFGSATGTMSRPILRRIGTTSSTIS